MIERLTWRCTECGEKMSAPATVPQEHWDEQHTDVPPIELVDGTVRPRPLCEIVTVHDTDESGHLDE